MRRVMPDPMHTPLALVGAGPIGLEMAVALRRADLDCVHFDKGQVASTIEWFPPGMTFFSSNDRIAIAGAPLQTLNQSKCTKEQYLAYLRSVAMQFELPIRTHEAVTAIAPLTTGGFEMTTRNAAGEHAWRADKIILATGDMDRPRLLHIPGEDLPHVDHYFHDPHTYFRKRVLIVGGKNSAAEAALRCYHAGAHVTLCYRRPAFEAERIKYWILPELLGRIDRGEIACHYAATPESITPTHARLRPTGPEGAPVEVEADFVLLLTGYEADMRLFEMAGAELIGDRQRPKLDERTMQTSVPGLYAAGTATAGTQASFKVFIENCHVHVDRILAHLTGAPPPPVPQPIARPES